MENVEREWWENRYNALIVDGRSPRQAFTELLTEATRRGYEKGLSDADEIICKEMDKTRRVDVSDADFLQWRTETGNAILSRLQALKSSKV